MVAPRALVFRPLVKGNEALGTRLAQYVKCSVLESFLFIRVDVQVRSTINTVRVDADFLK